MPRMASITSANMDRDDSDQEEAEKRRLSAYLDNQDKEVARNAFSPNATVVYQEQESELYHDRLEFGRDRAAYQDSVLIGGSASGDVSQQDIMKREDRNRWKKLKELSKHHINKIVDDQMA